MEWRAYQANADTDLTKIREWGAVLYCCCLSMIAILGGVGGTWKGAGSG